MTTSSPRLLDVLVATHGRDGLDRVAAMQLPVTRGVHYIVTWQASADAEIPPSLQREDMEIHRLDSIGLSHNRNAGIALSQAPLCLVADNDLRYRPGAFETVIKAFDDNPDIVIATFRHNGPGNRTYPATEVDFTKKMPKWYCPCSFETAFRRDGIGDLRFNTKFGVGTDIPTGEDSIFILDCRQRGFRCRFFPVTIVDHPGLSTGYRAITHPGVAFGEGAYIRRAYGLAGYPRIPLFAYRAWRSRRMPFWWGLRHLTAGFFSRL